MTQSELSKALHNRKFQLAGALFAIQKKNVLIADEPGCGKTIQAIGAVVGSKVTGSVLVIAPKTACYVTWPAELKRWLPTNDPIRIIGGNQTKLERNRECQRMLLWDMNHEEGRQWIIVSPNYVRYNIKTGQNGAFIYDRSGNKIIVPVREAISAFLYIDWATIIVDEAHLTLAGATGNIKRQSAQSRGIRLLNVKSDGLRIALSGTPFRGKHENLWGILNWLEPQEYTSYWKWIKKHFTLYMDFAIGREVIGSIKSETNLAKECSKLMIRRTKSQVAKDLPPKSYGGTPLFKGGPIAVWLPMFGVQRKAYEQMAREALAEIEGGTLMANGILAEIIRLKQFANSYGYLDDDEVFIPRFPSNKLEWIIEFLNERGIDGNGVGSGKVVIASQFTKFIGLCANALTERGIEFFALTGQTSSEDRELMQKMFQTSSLSPQVFLINTRAGGVSLTLDAADDIIIVDSTHNPDDQVQVEDRLHRISRMHKVTVWSLASSNSIDESVLRHTHQMHKSLSKILDGEGRVEMARKMIAGGFYG